MHYLLEGRKFSGRDGKFEEGNARFTVFFRGEPRKISELMPDELRAALLDAHCDLEIASRKAVRIGVVLEMLHEDVGLAPSRLERVGADVSSIEQVVDRHRVPREVEEELRTAGR